MTHASKNILLRNLNSRKIPVFDSRSTDVRSNPENPENANTRVTNIMCDYCAWISEILARVSAETQIKKKKKPRVDPIVIVHGGAGRIPRYARKFMLDEVKLFVIHIK